MPFIRLLWSALFGYLARHCHVKVRQPLSATPPSSHAECRLCHCQELAAFSGFQVCCNGWVRYLGTHFAHAACCMPLAPCRMPTCWPRLVTLSSHNHLTCARLSLWIREMLKWIAAFEKISCNCFFWLLAACLVLQLAPWCCLTNKLHVHVFNNVAISVSASVWRPLDAPLETPWKTLSLQLFIPFVACLWNGNVADTFQTHTHTHRHAVWDA